MSSSSSSSASMPSSTKSANNNNNGKFWKKSAFKPPGSVVAVHKTQPRSFPARQSTNMNPIDLSTKSIATETYTGTIISSKTLEASHTSQVTATVPPPPPPTQPAPPPTAEPFTGVSFFASAEEERAKKAEQPKLSKADKIRQLINEPVLDTAALRKLAWSGVPAEVRPEVWKLLMGYLPANKEERTETLRRKREEYHLSIPQFMDPEKNETERTTIHQISIDLPRTAPTDPVLAHPKVRLMMERMLYIWAMLHPASGYVQGFNDIITPIILVLLTEHFPNSTDKNNTTNNNNDNSNSSDERGSVIDKLSEDQLEALEADTYWCFSKLLDSIQDNYTPKQPGIIRQLDELQQLVKLINEHLDKHFEEEHLMYIEFSFRWVNCLMLRDLPFNLVIRLWDTYVAEPNGEGFSGFHVYVCAALLTSFAKELLGLGMPDLIIFLQHLPTNSWTEGDLEAVVSQAYVYRSLYENSIHLKQFK